ncbi:MAG: HEAT repeat domain-containing protein [Mariprofundaceae bacterium]
MRVIYLIINVLLACFLEGYAWDTMLSQGERSVSMVLLYHLSASVFAAIGCVLIDTGFQDRAIVKFSIFFTIIALMPGFGLVGVYTFILHAVCHPKNKQEALWQEVRIPDLPFMPVKVDDHPTYGEGGLASVIASSRDVDRRVQAVIAARQINDKMAIPLLQEALKDKEDDVRLFAYSVLDSKISAINDRITALIADNDLVEGKEKARSSYALAQNYWELAFLGLAAGSTLDFVLDQAEKHANEAANLGWAGSDIEFLIGRIHLYQKQYEQAEHFFRTSLENGALKSAILPFLSEIYYEKYDFKGLRKMLKQLNDTCDGHTPIPAVVNGWITS